MKVGRKPNLVRVAYALRFGFDPDRKPALNFRNSLLCQLSECKSDEARRLILGVKEKSH